MEDMVTTSFWRDRRTLVTGATGFLGSWLVEDLLRAGADVICLVRDWQPKSRLVTSGSLDRTSWVSGDVTDQTLIERILGEYEVETVFHLAAQTIVPIANRNPASTFHSNVAGTWSLLEAARRSPLVRQIIVASSDKAYGANATLPYDENTPLQGRTPYDVSKSCADLIAQSFADTFELPVVITRCGNLFGGGDLNWSRLIPGTIRSILRGEAPIIRSDGTFVRDYFYVEDGAAAYRMLAEALATRPDLSGNAFNFSNEQPRTVIEVVSEILDLMDSDLQPLILNEASQEIQEQHLDASKARETLMWRPLFSPIDGLQTTIRWYRSFLEG